MDIMQFHSDVYIFTLPHQLTPDVQVLIREPILESNRLHHTDVLVPTHFARPLLLSVHVPQNNTQPFIMMLGLSVNIHPVPQFSVFACFVKYRYVHNFLIANTHKLTFITEHPQSCDIRNKIYSCDHIE